MTQYIKFQTFLKIRLIVCIYFSLKDLSSFIENKKPKIQRITRVPTVPQTTHANISNAQKMIVAVNVSAF